MTTRPCPPKGPEAARLRRRIQQLLDRGQLPPDGLPGSLARSHFRCGKPSCHCADGQGHPVWSLTFMLDGKKRVEKIPPDWVDSIRPRVEQARKFKETVAEIFTATPNSSLSSEISRGLSPRGGKQRAKTLARNQDLIEPGIAGRSGVLRA